MVYKTIKHDNRETKKKYVNYMINWKKKITTTTYICNKIYLPDLQQEKTRYKKI